MAVNPNIKKKADDIRTKVYGSEVRESLASGLEAMSSDVVETVGRQGNVESQFQDVIENTTDKDVISAPEIIAARNGEANLKTRIDKDHQEVTTQLAQTQERPLGLTHRNPAIFDTEFDQKPMLSIVSDDGNIEDFTLYKPILDEYGYKMTLAIQTGYMEDGFDKYGRPLMTWEQVRQMYNEGHTIASHTISHPRLPELSEIELDKELRESRDTLLNKGFDVRHIMYPYGETSSLVYEVTRKYYLSGANIYSGLPGYQQYPANIPRISIERDSIEKMKSDVDTIIATNGWGVFYFHGYTASESQLVKLRSLLEYVSQKEIEVVTYDEGYDRFIRREKEPTPYAKFYYTNTVELPINSTTLPVFDGETKDGKDIFEYDKERNIINIKESGLYAVSFSLALHGKENLQATFEMKERLIQSNGNLSPGGFILGDFLLTTNQTDYDHSNVKRFDYLSGQTFFKNNADDRFVLDLGLIVRGSTDGQTTLLVGSYHVSHLTIVKID